MTDPRPSLAGLLVADKGAGVTSFQVVAYLRRILRVPKVGHGGTLDPMATGVLPILLGEATKLTPYLQARDKEYLVTIRLGRSTDTLDATGRVTEERPVPALDAGSLRVALDRFVGEIEQVPPMFSAIHVGGRRLHELARAGVEVARAPRRVRIDTIELLEWASPLLKVRVACGTGTYVRSLAADLGALLDCGASVDALCRTRLGDMTLSEAVDWDVIMQGDPAVLAARVLPPDRAVGHLPALALDEPAVRRLLHGQAVGPESLPRPLTGACRLYVGDTFCGIGEVTAGGVRPLRLWHADLPRTRPVSG